MQDKRVVYCKGPDHWDVYVGRPTHFGNPWTHKFGTAANFIVKSRTIAVDNYEKWLRGQEFTDILPDQRSRILKDLPSLSGKILACHCNDDKPCHGQILAKLVDEIKEKNK